MRRFEKRETAYQKVQGTKPQTLAYALNDSPAGLAAWILEKFKVRSSRWEVQGGGSWVAFVRAWPAGLPHCHLCALPSIPG